MLSATPSIRSTSFLTASNIQTCLAQIQIHPTLFVPIPHFGAGERQIHFLIAPSAAHLLLYPFRAGSPGSPRGTATPGLHSCLVVGWRSLFMHMG
jgi:hypothetical protein